MVRRWSLVRPLPERLADADAATREIAREEIEALFGRLVVVRLFAVPVIALVGLGLVLVDPDPWRFRAAAAVVGGLGIVGGIEYLRHRAGWTGPLALPVNLVFMAGVQLTMIFASGGLQSPVAPAIVPLTFLGALLIGPRPLVGALLAVQLLGVGLFVVGPLTGWLPDPRLAPLHVGPLEPVWLVTFGAGFAIVVVAATGIGLGLRRTFEGMIRRALTAREAERQAHAEHARDLVALSGEIAHELKNPLASVKGLGALLARDVEGRSAERLAVLRGEVDRMQDILQEFLDFSRPLVPLDQTRVALGALCAEVAGLQEGLARPRGVRIVVEGDASCRCDRRKVRQVLVNVVQNAVDAARSTVIVRVIDGEPVRIEVADDGPGLPAHVRERIFEAGVTTKPHGSGLGLTIARSLMRQQGGELVLEGVGGTVARLTLPRGGLVEEVV